MISVRLDVSRSRNAFDVARVVKEAMPRIERAALTATHQAAERAKNQIRREMSGAGLGRLGQAIGATSDQKKTGSVYRTADGWSASGVVHIRSKSPRTVGAIEAYTKGAVIRPVRTVGAIEAYTKGAVIRPVRSRWLWFPTDQIPRIGAGKKRLTPATWKSSGMEAKIGPLVRVKADNGNPLLVVRNVGVATSGKARSLKKNGMPRKGQTRQESIVAFIGIPHTQREAKVDVQAILKSVQAELPDLFAKAYGVR